MEGELTIENSLSKEQQEEWMAKDAVGDMIGMAEMALTKVLEGKSILTQ